MAEHRNVNEYEWPYNLMAAMCLDGEDALETLGDIGNVEVAMCMCRLTEREKIVLRTRYVRGLNLNETAKEFGLSRERIRQIEAKALRKMRGPNGNMRAPVYIMEHGAKAYVEMRIERGIQERIDARRAELEKEYQTKMAELNRIIEERGLEPIPATVVDEARENVMVTQTEELNLSVRAYNCLKRSGCDTVRDILRKYPTYEDAMKIRNLGRKSMEEVSVVLRGYGVNWPLPNEE